MATMVRELDPSDLWSWWRLALDDPTRIGEEPLIIHPSEPHCGYYRVLVKGRGWEAVGIYPDPDRGNQLYAERDGKAVPTNKQEDLWVWCCRNPISFEAYERALSGGGWEDEPPPSPGMGDRREAADPLDALQIEFDALAADARDLLEEPIRRKPEADKAAIMASRMLSVKRRADTMHDVEKAPILKQGRDIDAKYAPLREDSAALAKLLKEHQQAWLDEEERKERERVAAAKREDERLRREAAEAEQRARAERERAAREARRVQEEAARVKREAEERERRATEEAERAKRAAERAKSEEARRIALESARAAEQERVRLATEAATIKRRADAEAARLAEEAQRAADAAEAEAGAKISESLAARRETVFVNPSAGRIGQKTKMTTYTKAEIIDIDVLFAAIKGYDEVKEWLQKLADKAAKSGFPLPGTKIVKERRAS